MKVIHMKKQFDYLFAELRSKDGVKRKHARNALVKIGKPTVPLLISLIADQERQMRWEVCKALGNMSDPADLKISVALDGETVHSVIKNGSYIFSTPETIAEVQVDVETESDIRAAFVVHNPEKSGFSCLCSQNVGCGKK